MREILFRGKRVDGAFGDKWIEGSLWNNYGEVKILSALSAIGYEVIPETVGQYTGLTDKNGKKIFEGDIIRYSDSGEYEMYLESLECPEEYDGINFENMWTIDEVVYGIAINYPAFDLNRHDWEVNGLSNLSESGCYFYEVIGNIHDNPELLKEGDESVSKG